GQIENTLVFVASDNGPEEDIWPDSGHTPFRGAKGSTWEGGTRVPGIVYWPGVIKPGRISDGLFDLADLFNTSLALAGLQNKLPEDRYIDGIDQTSFLLADNGESNRKCVFFTYVDKMSAIRIDEYKIYEYIIDSGYGGYQTMGSMNDGRLVVPTLGLLFNLYMDPKERSPILLRKAWVIPIFEQEGLRFQETFKKYPPKKLQLPTFK
ncbi:MAG: sulfatase-like hydrolase/transferase, partial [Candidatus Latescibacteria bacterium]|nr:sulfatase-like hydrolase/transferase [Candidatus Latescibacterota bacterium]